MADQFDSVNKPSYESFMDDYAVEGWCDPGELGAVLSVADRVRDREILDIGVGGGRTTSLLRLLSRDYVGIDYTPDLVDLCRARHPGVDIRHGDARALTDFAAGSRDLVMFSHNGIDSVGHEDRQLILAEVARVLRPGGIFLFSTMNKDNPTFGGNPGTVPDNPYLIGSLLPRPIRTVAVPDDGDDPKWARAVRGWRRLRDEVVDHGDWGLAANPGHEFTLLNHFTTLEGEHRELSRHGFAVDEVFSSESAQPVPTGQPVESIYMYFVARRVASAGAGSGVAHPAGETACGEPPISAVRRCCS